ITNRPRTKGFPGFWADGSQWVVRRLRRGRRRTADSDDRVLLADPDSGLLLIRSGDPARHVESDRQLQGSLAVWSVTRHAPA
ncbi:hypothetical protein ACWDRX_37175, partial [Streptomyces nigra]